MMSSPTTCKNKNQSRTCGKTKANQQQLLRNRKTHVYVSSSSYNSNSTTNFDNFSSDDEEQEFHDHSMTILASQAQYKWTHHLTTVIQSAFELLVKLILSFVSFLWNWASDNLIVFLRDNRILNKVWNYIIATMTVEIVTSTPADPGNPKSMDSTTVSPLTSLPVLRLNSVALDGDEFHTCNGILLEEDEDRHDAGIESGGSDFIHSSTNYSSSDGEQDTIIFTDDENNYSNKNLASTLQFLEKQQQQYSTRRDSDSSCDESKETSSNSNDSNNKAEDLETRIINQVESMFSDDHLAKDGFLLKHVKRRTDGYVSLKLVAGLRKVKQISKDFNVVVEALRNAKLVEVNEEGSKVRRIEPLTSYLKALPTSGNKDKENNGQKGKTNKKSNNGNDNNDLEEADSDLTKCLRTKGHNNYSNNMQNLYQRRSQRYSNASSGSSVSPPSSACSSRNGSFSAQPGGELFNRNCIGSPSDESLLTGQQNQQVVRRRGTSLPIAAHQQQKRHSHSGKHHLSPNSSPPNTAQQRPKSNSYCEGTNINGSGSPGGMSAWLQKRLASTRTSEGNISISTVIRQPRGPDGSKGFQTGFRQMILQERQGRERKIGQQMI